MFVLRFLRHTIGNRLLLRVWSDIPNKRAYSDTGDVAECGTARVPRF